ncbi:MAG: cation diffusion facilitator family transporter [Bacteroidales bacterium]|jgi:cobalt-zinc-cadmium efflux system protein|nr:cation diffusion facilitator family transporter [Bacteroidales bacterium]MCI2121325.1 cation diffusion facilitator family transporter [Bacteroidales bacterium]MCI2145924.1 cation diffusion facilitator family transporter [Bacteroidales bacterium]
MGNGSHNQEHHLNSLNRAFITGICLNAGFVVVEFVFGVLGNSMGLLSDAGHNLSDVASLALSMLAFKLAKVPGNSRYTYGYKKSTILVSLLNAVILLIAVGLIVSESIRKLIKPQEVRGSTIIIVAAVGVVVNAFSAFLFMKDSRKDLNVKGAFLHLIADTLVSVGVVISGVVIMFTGWYVLDPIIGLVVACVIVYSTWSLLRESFRLSMDGVPEGIDMEDVCRKIRSAGGVVDVHHIHVWAISTTETALTAHVVIRDPERMSETKAEIKTGLLGLGINHVTIEFETESDHCSEKTCCAENDFNVDR